MKTLALLIILSVLNTVFAQTNTSSQFSNIVNLRSTVQTPTTPILDNEEEPMELQDRAISILRSVGWIAVRSEPNKMAGFECPSGVSRTSCRNARSLNHSTELILTGNRECDRDNNVCFVEARFENNGNSFTGWFDEKETSLDPNQAYVRQQTARTAEELLEENSSEVSSSDYTLDMSPEAIESRNELGRALIEQQTEEARDAQLRAERANAMFPTSRGLLRLNNPNTRAGLCGSYDYSDDGGTESYASPTAACAIAQLAERWRKEQCPSNGACRLQIGDISHPTRERFDGHRTHTHGHCVDFQTIRKERSTTRVDFNDSNYDQEKTEQLLRMLRELGGTEIIFNDRDMIAKGLSRHVGNHNSHIHVCFRPDNETVEQQCLNYQPDARLCPNTNTLFGHPFMIELRANLEAKY